MTLPSLALLGAGFALFISGIKITSRSRSEHRSAMNQGLSFFGNIKQSISGARLSIQGKPESNVRDLIGWSLSALGLILVILAAIGS